MVEIKRVFVEKLYRKQGIARELMNQIESYAKENGYEISRLETGKSMLPARGLYSSIGYREIANYGVYKDIDTSICYEKKL